MEYPVKKMKRAVIPLLAALCVLLLTLCVPLAPTVSASGSPGVPRVEDTGYDDVPADAWYAEAVAWCGQNGLMNGTSERRFSPGGTMTRAMAAAVLYRMEGSPVVSPDSGFTDVPDWCAAAVAWAARTGVASGYDGARFGPGDPVTRQQMAVFLWRYSGSPAAVADGQNGGGDSTNGQSGGGDSTNGQNGGQDRAAFAPFTDQDQIGGYALEAVRWAQSAGIINGYSDGSFRPRGTATRAQMARILMNYGKSGLGRFARSAQLRELSGPDALYAPVGIAAGEGGSLLVTDAYQKAVWLVRDGVWTRYAGGSSPEDIYGQPVGGFRDGTLLDSLFRLPWGIAPFQGGWAVSDAENNAVRLLLPSETRTITPPASGGASFHYPTGLAADGDGNLYVSDTHAGTILKLAPSGVFSTAAEGLNDPMGLCWHDGTLYAAETGANRIVRIVDGRVETVAGTGEDGLEDGPALGASFSCPQGLASDGAGTLYVSDTANGAVRRIRDGMVETIVRYDPAEMESWPVSPVGLAVSGDTLYVCDQFSRKVFLVPLN